MRNYEVHKKRRSHRLVRCLLAVGLAAALPLAAGANAKDKAWPTKGYLKPGSFDILKVLPAAPQKGDARYEADRKIFKITRKFIGTKRWKMATNDVKFPSPNMLRDFSCAVGVTLTPKNAPLVVALVEKASVDTAGNTHIAKEHFKRLRPFLIDDGETCQKKSEVVHSYDYPSGHTTWGWTWAQILSGLAPDRATQILARGRAFGESRVVCGVHNASAVEAGRLSAMSTLAAVQTTAGYKADFAKAKAELDALRHNPQAEKPKHCAIEAKLVAQDIFHP